MWHVQGGGDGGTKKHSSWLRPVDGEAKPEQIVEPCDTRLKALQMNVEVDRSSDMDDQRNLILHLCQH